MLPYQCQQSVKFLILQEPLSFRRKVVCKETQINIGRSLGRERWGEKKHSEIIPWFIWIGAEVRGQAESVDVLGKYFPCPMFLSSPNQVAFKQNNPLS